MRTLTVIVILLLVLVPVAIFIAQRKFERESRAAVEQLFANPKRDIAELVRLSDLDALPPLVRQWLITSGVVGKPRVRTVRIQQRGALRTSRDGSFMPVEAVQYFRTDQPGFVWCANVTMLHVLPLAGRDSYMAGHGRMLIRLGGLLPVVDATGAQLDEATLQRYLAELVWFPAAALDPRIQWRVQGEQAEAALVDHGVKATVTFHIDAEGKFRRLTALRFKDSGPNARRERWLVTAEQWGELADTIVPTKGEVRWQLDEGDLTFYRWQVDELVYNPAGVQ